jgi:3',5'-cyclic AMP phosphodiesterase CpdA
MNQTAGIDMTRTHATGFRLAVLLLAATLASCDSNSPIGSGSTDGRNAPATPARCVAMVDEPSVTRNELAAGSRSAESELLLRFIHLTDDHIIDDDGQAVIGASVIDPLNVQFESAMRLQEEYSDELLNNLVGRINQCNAAFPSEFSIVTGDSADLTTVAEIRRFIDNLDGTFDQMSAFETACRAAQPAGTAEEVLQLQCTRFTGRGVADTRTPDQNLDSILTQPLLTRTALQLAATETASLTGRGDDGSLDPSRQTVTRAPGMPQSLRCESGSAGCINNKLTTPWYMVFGNHDGYVRGTLPLELGINEAALLFGRHFMVRQSEFIREFFNTRSLPGPVGHGFNFVESTRFADANDRNDGYYAFDAGNGRFRMIVMNTILDGVDPRVPFDMLRNPAALADGGMDSAQFAWLDGQLQRALDNDQLAMVFSHHPDLTFAEFGTFAPLVQIEVSAAQLNARLASYPNLIAWVAGHTHRHRVRPFKVTNGVGTNLAITTPVTCKVPGACNGFWQIESASLIDFPQEQRLIEVFDNGDGTGTIRGPILGHSLEVPRALAEADDRCALYLADPASAEDILTEADLGALCAQGGTRTGTASDRNVELIFRMPS